MLNKLKKNNKKGFTLVELIVVLVILAILAALLIPALTGYIDKARQKQIIAQTRQAVMAAQVLVDEKYGTGVTGTQPVIGESGDIKHEHILALAELPDDGTLSGIQLTDAKIVDGSGSDLYKYTIATLTYQPKDSAVKCVYIADLTNATINSSGYTENYTVVNVSGTP